MTARSLTAIHTASPPPRTRHLLLAALTALTLGCAAPLAGPAPALAAACPNESLRAESRSTLLAQCRAYELVSPVYTADRGLPEQGHGFLGAAPDAEVAAFRSLGAFANAQGNTEFGSWYIAQRRSEGWETQWVGLPHSLHGAPHGMTLSADLTKMLQGVGLDVGEPVGSEQESDLFLGENLLAAPKFSVQDVAAFKELPGNPHNMDYRGEQVYSSPDFSTVVVEGFAAEAEVPGVLWELSGVGGAAPVARLLGVDRKGNMITAHVGSDVGESGSLFHAVSNDGAVIFYTSGVSYVSVNASTTLELGGVFQGASEDGSKVFLRGAGGRLYMDVIDSKPGEETVTETVPIAPAGQSNTYLRSSDDGSHVYFNSTAVLAGNENGNTPEEKAAPGKPNLYVYDTVTKETSFIAQVLLEDNGGTVEAQVNGCPSAELGESEEPGCEGGRFFVFSSTARLTAEETGGGQNVYEYDAAGGGHLVRVSIGEAGYDQYADGSAFHASIAADRLSAVTSEAQTEVSGDNTRAVSDDGSTVVFTSTQPLSPRALNHQPDIYEYHEGQVSMISTGHSPTRDEQPTITPSGENIFFTTTEGIVPQDSDGLRSLYDARIDGGFPAPIVPPGGCNGDACQGPPSVPDLLGAPASATFSGLGNPAPPAPAPAVKPKPKPKPVKCKKGYVKKKNKCVRAKARKAKRASRDRGVRS